MADILKALLEAYQTDIISHKATTLNWLSGQYIVQSPELLSSDWAADLPCILIYPQSIVPTPACLPSVYADQKIYTIMLSILADGTTDPGLGFLGDTYRTGILTMAQDIETLYRRETFSLSDTVFCSRIDFTPRRIPPIGGRMNINQAHLTFQHDYMDMRAA